MVQTNNGQLEALKTLLKQLKRGRKVFAGVAWTTCLTPKENERTIPKNVTDAYRLGIATLAANMPFIALEATDHDSIPYAAGAVSSLSMLRIDGFLAASLAEFKILTAGEPLSKQLNLVASPEEACYTMRQGIQRMKELAAPDYQFFKEVASFDELTSEIDMKAPTLVFTRNARSPNVHGAARHNKDWREILGDFHKYAEARKSDSTDQETLNTMKVNLQQKIVNWQENRGPPAYTIMLEHHLHDRATSDLAENDFNNDWRIDSDKFQGTYPGPFAIANPYRAANDIFGSVSAASKLKRNQAGQFVMPDTSISVQSQKHCFGWMLAALGVGTAAVAGSVITAIDALGLAAADAAVDVVAADVIGAGSDLAMEIAETGETAAQELTQNVLASGDTAAEQLGEGVLRSAGEPLTGPPAGLPTSITVSAESVAEIAEETAVIVTRANNSWTKFQIIAAIGAAASTAATIVAASGNKIPVLIDGLIEGDAEPNYDACIVCATEPVHHSGDMQFERGWASVQGIGDQYNKVDNVWNTTPLTFNAYFWKKKEADSDATLKIGSKFTLVVFGPNKRLDFCGMQQDLQTGTKDVKLTIHGNPLAVVSCDKMTIDYKTDSFGNSIYEKTYSFIVTSGWAYPGSKTETRLLAESILPSAGAIMRNQGKYEYLGLLVMSLQGNLTTNDAAPMGQSGVPEGRIAMHRDQFTCAQPAGLHLTWPLKSCMVWQEPAAGGTMVFQFDHSGFPGPKTLGDDSSTTTQRYLFVVRCPDGNLLYDKSIAGPGFHQDGKVDSDNVNMTVKDDQGTIIPNSHPFIHFHKVNESGGVHHLSARRFGIGLDVGPGDIPAGTMRLTIPGGLLHYVTIPTLSGTETDVDQTFSFYVLIANGEQYIPLYASTIPITCQELTDSQSHSDLQIPTWRNQC